MIEPKFKPNDYIINRKANDIAIIKSITTKGYYHFKKYYSNMFDEFRDATNKLNDLQIDYQKFWDFCNDEEKQKLDQKKKKKGEK